MRYLGIDYGSKRVGLAISDESGEFAFPLVVLPNDNKLLAKVVALCAEKRVERVIIGQSLNYRGEPNPIQEQIERFKLALAKEANLPVDFETELLTTAEAGRGQASEESSDDQAAAVILRHYLDRQKHAH